MYFGLQIRTSKNPIIYENTKLTLMILEERKKKTHLGLIQGYYIMPSLKSYHHSTFVRNSETLKIFLLDIWPLRDLWVKQSVW